MKTGDAASSLILTEEAGLNWEPHGASALLSGSRALAMFSSLWSRALGLQTLSGPSGLEGQQQNSAHSHRRLCTGRRAVQNHSGLHFKEREERCFPLEEENRTPCCRHRYC
ncbi:unnamed protein product [Gadus morhua 'NCC']